jgi:hypothetical protein
MNIGWERHSTMRKREVRIPWDDVQDPEKITDYNLRLFKEHDMELKGNECDIEDDPDRRERIMRLKPATRYFFRKG